MVIPCYHRSMARLKRGNLKKPWKAECRIQYHPWFLGYFETKEQAESVERSFRMDMRGSPEPRRKDSWG